MMTESTTAECPVLASPSGAATVTSAVASPQKLGLGLLVALVVGSILGSGIFSLPQNMAAGAGAGAILIGWCITGVGMLALARTYQMLALHEPTLDNGVFAYARALSGNYAGFNSAWGYWVSAWVGNVGYLVAAMAALGSFVPGLGEGNTPAAVLAASVLLWTVHALVLRGLKGAAVLNAVITVAKLLPLLLFIVLVAMAFQLSTLRLDIWGAPALGSVLAQVRSTMLVTVWVFIGIEGASVYSARALHRQDVGRATLLGFAISLVLLVAVSLLSLGVANQPQLAAMPNPSMAGVLSLAVGPWGAALISVGVLVSVGGGFLAWTLLAAESLFSPARGQVMPAWLAQQNRQGVPAHALWLTNGLVQVFLLVTLYSRVSYLALISLSTAMILVPYLFSAAFGLARSWAGSATQQAAWRRADTLAAGVATVYCLWLLYAAGLKYLMLSALLYAPGLLLYFAAQGRKGRAGSTPAERVAMALVVVLAAVSAVWLATGQLAL